MLRSHRVLLLSHCVLNQNAVVYPLARSKGSFKELIHLIQEHDFGIIQLSCAETLMYGMDRPPMTKAQYDIPEYKSLCNELASHDYQLIEKFLESKVQVAGIIGIDQSPTCSQIRDEGHFMHAIKKFRAIENLPSIDIPESYEPGTQKADDFHSAFKAWLKSL
jgi:predicted secreted protein